MEYNYKDMKSKCCKTRIEVCVDSKDKDEHYDYSDKKPDYDYKKDDCKKCDCKKDEYDYDKKDYDKKDFCELECKCECEEKKKECCECDYGYDKKDEKCFELECKCECKEKKHEDKCKEHVHEFYGSVDIVCEGGYHNHRFCGVTCEEIKLPCGSHKHKFETKTDTFCDHYHEICGETGPAIYVGCGRHVHFAAGETKKAECHDHCYKFATLIENPIGYEKREK